ncbi:MAG: hypothetical protein P8018_10010 [Acidobacteriota bacterium]|jgi:type IV secretory pathway TrbD component
MIEPHKLHRALNERLTIAGYNVLELLAAYLAFYYACTFGNLKLGLIALAASAVLIRYGKSRDPRFLELVIRARHFGSTLDATKKDNNPWHFYREF